MKNASSKRDVYAEVTDRIIAELEAGTVPWVRPWNAVAGNAVPHNAATGRAYNGINVLLCWATQMHAGYTSNAWLTFKQAKDLGGHVRKGEKGTAIVFWKFNKRTERNEDGTDNVVTIPMARVYTVFNVEQCDGLKLPKRETAEPETTEHERHQMAEHVMAAAGVSIRHGGDKAYYSPAGDYVQLPELATFKEAAGYYATALHELTHSTGHSSRLDRNLTGRFGTESYAAEELVAELGASFMCAELGIQGDLRHAGYIESWLRVLKQDKRAIFTASRLATQAADWLKDRAGMGEVQQPSEQEQREAA
jgi:antirestriction protein ArdC